MFQIKALRCERGQRILFSGLTFKVEPGQLVLVRGPNGSGKSSLLKILAGLLPASSGQRFWRGEKIEQPDPRFAAELLYLGHRNAVEPSLTPVQNLVGLLRMTALLIPTTREIEIALQKVALGGFEHIPCEALSKGQCQRVALARLWLNPPPCWILDEPVTALDQAGIDLFNEALQQHLEKQGLAILATHHDFSGSDPNKRQADFCSPLVSYLDLDRTSGFGLIE